LQAFLDLIERKYISTETEHKPIEFGTRITFLTLDVLSDLAYGEPFGYVTKDEDLFGYVEQANDSLPVVTMFCVMPAIMDWLTRWPLNMLLPGDGKDFGLAYMMG